MSRRTLTFILLSILLLPAPPAGAGSRAAQDWRKFPEVDFRVNSVGLGDSYQTVREKLGEPYLEQRAREPRTSCEPEHTKLTMDYAGLKVELRDARAGHGFRVSSVEITSDEWEVSPGVRVGMDKESVLALLGEPGIDMAEAGRRAFMYATKGKTGGAALTFRSEIVYQIEWQKICDKQKAVGGGRRRRRKP